MIKYSKKVTVWCKKHDNKIIDLHFVFDLTIAGTIYETMPVCNVMHRAMRLSEIPSFFNNDTSLYL